MHDFVSVVHPSLFLSPPSLSSSPSSFLHLPPSPSSLLQAVFRVYDTDQSGNISTDEFDAISSNFPFIECFSVLDQDKLVTLVTLCYTVVQYQCMFNSSLSLSPFFRLSPLPSSPPHSPLLPSSPPPLLTLPSSLLSPPSFPPPSPPSSPPPLLPLLPSSVMV